MSGSHLSLFAPLREAYEASHRVRGSDDLDEVLERVAGLVRERLGWGTVVLNVHRRAWDDFEAAVVVGNDAARDALLGTTQTWAQWAPMFRDRFERRGAHFISHEAELQSDLPSWQPGEATADGPDAWHPEDLLLVLMRGSDGEVTGVLSVDEPESGRRPSDDDLDALVAVANAAGAAIQQAYEAAKEAQHRVALEQLLAVSTRIADARSGTDVLEAVCAGIRDALGFQRVAIELAGDGGLMKAAAQVGWSEAPAVPIPIDHFARIFRPEYEEQGCYVIDHVDALRLLGLPDAPYESQLNGRGPWAWSRHWLCVPLRDPSGRPTGFIWADEPHDRLLPDTPRLQALRLFADQAQAALEAAQHYEMAVHMAEHDGLTGLPNRAVMLDRLRHALLRARRAHTTIAVLFVDLDRFKTINDTHGHEVGDEVLRTVAARIDAGLRPGDTVARLGGDEFVVLCEDVRGQEDAVEVARRIRARVSQPISVGTLMLTVTGSVGIALPRTSGDDPSSLLHFADVAMYRAKDSGRDGEAVASEAMRAGASARAQLERALGGALGRGEILLHYQPIVSTTTDRIVRAEALMRWVHPGLGYVSPLEFIPLAEENGCIVDLGRWALEEACAQWARWREQFGPDSPGIAVNLSPRQLKDGGLSDHVAGLIRRHRIPVGALSVEITEGVLLDANPNTVTSLAGLREHGCSIDLDDFGTGYSSLSSLEDFHVDGLKIDRRFVSGQRRDSRAGAIAEAVLAMATALGLRATGEGVESAEQLEWLRDRGCAEAQGFLFARPQPAEEFERLLVRPVAPVAEAPAAASAP
ncbi:MAG: putative Diguanylate cyclase/phosphodiesterase [Solirubrobacteraceae bacterium]|nr:putative Diguanylate cyclase/phosphodiesterase [Solirubrobacteraceae bacterium]